MKVEWMIVMCDMHGNDVYIPLSFKGLMLELASGARGVLALSLSSLMYLLLVVYVLYQSVAACLYMLVASRWFESNHFKLVPPVATVENLTGKAAPCTVWRRAEVGAL